jgi:hypothetical protein
MPFSRYYPSTPIAETFHTKATDSSFVTLVEAFIIATFDSTN